MNIQISIEIDGKKYTLEEARELHRQLGELFKEKETNPLSKWIYPTKPYEPNWSPLYPPYTVTCSNGITFHKSPRCVVTETNFPKLDTTC